jgi:hypothetical protein
MNASPRSFLRLATPLCLLAALAAGGCTTYYRVTDPASSRQYYTTDVDKNRDGSIEFDDAMTGSEVTLQSSEIKTISKDEYKAAVKK